MVDGRGGVEEGCVGGCRGCRRERGVGVRGFGVCHGELVGDERRDMQHCRTAAAQRTEEEGKDEGLALIAVRRRRSSLSQPRRTPRATGRGNVHIGAQPQRGQATRTGAASPPVSLFSTPWTAQGQRRTTTVATQETSTARQRQTDFVRLLIFDRGCMTARTLIRAQLTGTRTSAVLYTTAFAVGSPVFVHSVRTTACACRWASSSLRRKPRTTAVRPRRAVLNCGHAGTRRRVSEDECNSPEHVSRVVICIHRSERDNDLVLTMADS
ncbi:hypothetical protein L226DRAFT_124593 [Lentinus tigrinus ALCF2SS1-7]|uniref:Uncharacterized protein n=1 Tax=Lentinus tigrinus ALCF2SS1-6 TaxID=1328759 RepID=A0A5C2SSX1_9APHY|nr:hypothetical protein L227DRAFT_10414 [Lentinus tigrinus ALCF2SS1-6]RPD80928.1 hypothetical protein L226DRAFT_124593 [Lentinus tigrinus ALCF2SS1-7]